MNGRKAQVLVEFALAAAGLVALAFMTARVAYWMNQSLVERNERYQATRTQAGKQGAGLVEVSEVPGVHLIGPSPARTSPGSSQPADALSPSCDDGGLLATARQIRQEEIPRLHEELVYVREQLVETMREAKRLSSDARRMRDVEIPTLRNAASQSRAEANRLRQPVPCPPDMVQITDASGNLIWVNQNEGRMCGPSAEALAQAEAYEAQARELDARANDLERRVLPDLIRRAQELSLSTEAMVRRLRSVAARAQRTLGQAHEAEWRSRVACASGPDSF